MSKPARTPARQRGFTLIELMIVVAIAGILASVAVPVFVRYMYKSRSTEGDINLKDLWNRVRTYRYEVHNAPGTMVTMPPQFPDSAPPTPAGGCCIVGGRCPPDLSKWSHPTWRALQDFNIEKAHYYQYEVVSDNAAGQFQVHAYGDLDCDGDLSTYTITGTVVGDDVQSSGTPTKRNELE
jgi:prepilin-type N-terminal cleavage/methylation domain-containing protein